MRTYGFIIIALLFGKSCSNQTTTSSTSVAVVSEDPYASAIALEVLNRGGNAIDAAVATAFALAVSFPEAGNIGGGGFLVYRAADGSSTTFDFREKAPSAAHEEMFLDKNGFLRPTINHEGILSVGIPGTVAGMGKAHEKLGSLEWNNLMQPTILLARKGFSLSEARAKKLNKYRSKFQKYPESYSVFFPKDSSLQKAGNIIVQNDLAKTLERIAKNGWTEFYKGETADLIVKYSDQYNGIIKKKDLINYSAVERTPLTTSYKDYDIIGMPLPSSGGITIGTMFKMLANNKSLPEAETVEDYHLRAELMRIAFYQRAQFLGDPDLSEEHYGHAYYDEDETKILAKSILERKAGNSKKSKNTLIPEAMHTTHFSIVDAEGNAVSMTYTLEQNFGSRMLVEGAGFLLNNEMGDFNPVPGFTDSTGIIGTLANLVQPNKRMLSSMSPTIIEQNGKLKYVLGTRGGRTIINSVFQVSHLLMNYNYSLEKAVEASRIHHQWYPDRILMEESFNPIMTKELKAMGHVTKSLGRTLGPIMAIEYNPENNSSRAYADKRSSDARALTN